MRVLLAALRKIRYIRTFVKFCPRIWPQMGAECGHITGEAYFREWHNIFFKITFVLVLRENGPDRRIYVTNRGEKSETRE